MTITFNGRMTQVADGLTVAGLLRGHGLPETGVAVAVNAEVVPRHAWVRTPVRPGDAVEVVTAVQGG